MMTVLCHCQQHQVLSETGGHEEPLLFRLGMHKQAIAMQSCKSRDQWTCV